MFGRTQGHAVTPLVERSRVGANIGAGLSQAAAGLGKGLMAHQLQKAERKRDTVIGRELVNFMKTSGDLDEGQAESYLQKIESGSNAEISGLLDSFAIRRAYEASARQAKERRQRMKLAERADARAQESHQAQLDAAPAAQARQEATTRMINAQADGYELSTASKLAEIEATMAGRLMPAEQRKAVGDAFTKLRAEPAVKTFDAVSGLLSSLRENAMSPERSGPMDIGLIFSFMKVLDSNSTVREGEFATAQNSGSVPTSIINAYNKALSGEMLTAKQVKQFLGAAETAASGYAKSANKVRTQHLEQMEKLGVDSSLIAVPEFKVESSQVQSFDDVTAAEPPISPGTEVIIGGRRAIVE